MPVSKILDTARMGFAALVAGSRSIPMGDNGPLIAELAAQAALIRAAARGPRLPRGVRQPGA